MQEPEQNSQNDFMIEKIKERPINKRKLIRRTLITAAMAVIFGTIACVTFIVLEPVISNRLHPEEEVPSMPVQPIVFPEDQEEEEMSPEEMLAENIPSEENPGEQPDPEGSQDPEDTQEPEEPEGVMLDEEQIREILSGVVLNKENYGQIYTALTGYVEELNHSLVTVTGVRSDVDWFNNVEQKERQSSGLVIANNGVELLVLADYAPLQDAESMSMVFVYVGEAANALTGYHIPVTLKALDVVTNLAVLSANLEDIPANLLEEGGIQLAYLGSSNIRNMIGMPVVAVGSPMGISESVGYGMITAMSGQLRQVDANYKLIQTDIFGSSSAGGVLFNLQGQVVGIITSRNTGTDMKNLVCAYGISELKKRIEKMANGVPMAYLGVTGMDVTSAAHVQLGVPYGAFVQNVDMNSPAMLAGIQKGDVITMLGEHPVQSCNEYISALMQAEAESTVEITVMRAAQQEYKEMKFEVALGSR